MTSIVVVPCEVSQVGNGICGGEQTLWRTDPLAGEQIRIEIVTHSFNSCHFNGHGNRSLVSVNNCIAIERADFDVVMSPSLCGATTSKSLSGI